MPKGFLADRNDILVALYGYFLTEEAGPLVTVFDFKRRAVLLQSTSYISLLLESLVTKDLVESDVGANDVDVYTLSEAGILRAEEEVRDRGLTLDEFEVEFRRRLHSGLIVSADHADLAAAEADLQKLVEHLQRDNDVGSISPDEREIAIVEVSELRATIGKPKVRTSYLWNKANEILMWIMEKGAGTAVAELAKSALRHIHSFINVFFN